MMTTNKTSYIGFSKSPLLNPSRMTFSDSKSCPVRCPTGNMVPCHIDGRGCLSCVEESGQYLVLQQWKRGHCTQCMHLKACID